jgi:glycerophosphoryl diester phosphodiesterase
MTIAIAHRGYHVEHIENTLEAFASAAALGADMVELDCRLTADGHVVVLHDPTLARLWGVHKPVKGLDWDEVSRVTRHSYRIPELAEVLRAIELAVMVDVPGVKVLEASFAVVAAAGAVDRCMFAGHTGAMARLRQMSPAARIALSWGRRELPSAELLARTKPEWFNPKWRLAPPSVVDHMHEAGVGVSVWTVDRRRYMKRALRAGVDAVITNRTERLLPLLGRRGT